MKMLRVLRFTVAGCALMMSAGVAPAAADGADTPWTGAAITQTANRIDRIIATTPLVGTHVGVLAIDATGGTRVYARNADDTFVPGSLMKLITGINALRTLGPDFRFTTTLQGADTAVYLRGNGDPQLHRAHLREAVHAARAAGKAAGTIFRVDGSAFANDPYPVGWAIADRAFDYAAPITAVSVDENALHFPVQPGALGQAPEMRLASADRRALAPLVSIANRATTVGSGGATTVDAAWFDHENLPSLASGAALALGISGTIARDAGTQTIDAAIPYPRTFIERLLSGYAVEDTAAPGSPRNGVLWTHRSKTLAAMLPDMWKNSDNFVAECWLRAVAHAAPAHPATAEDGAAREIESLRTLGIAPSSIMIADGSGLSRQNAASPRVMTTVLRAAYRSPLRDTVLAALPVAGRSGTLARRFRGTSLEGAVMAKTGSLTNVSNIAGFLRTKSHGTIIFAIFADDALIDDAPLHDLQRRILTELQS